MNPSAEKGRKGAACRDAFLTLRANYLNAVRECERNRKPGDGLLGLKGGPAEDPCHDRFVEELSVLLESFYKDDPESIDTRMVLEALYDVPHKDSVPLSAYWMLIAVQGLCPELLQTLSREDACDLKEEFLARYRRWERLPVQNKILDALKKQIQ